MKRALLPFALLALAALCGWWVTRPLPSTPAPISPSGPRAASRPPSPPPPPPPAPPAPPSEAAREEPPPPPSGPKTVIRDNIVVDRLLGEHPLSLQWISWAKLGKVLIDNDDGLYRIYGEQRARGDYVKLDGVITEVSSKQFTFDGTVTTRVSYVADGRPCRRTGKKTFRITSKRRYWRMMEMVNGCDESPRLVDYIDIYFPQLEPDAKAPDHRTVAPRVGKKKRQRR